ncbi:MAG: hypothetical protein K0R26_947 [Bacteroidota bacterium]|jgi:hypothetical protein|nr:hypothetical protein [Bacteroidota bacterium]
MDELQEKLLERLAVLKRQIKKMYPELSDRLKDDQSELDPEKKKHEHPHKRG